MFDCLIVLCLNFDSCLVFLDFVLRVSCLCLCVCCILYVGMWSVVWYYKLCCFFLFVVVCCMMSVCVLIVVCCCVCVNCCRLLFVSCWFVHVVFGFLIDVFMFCVVYKFAWFVVVVFLFACVLGVVCLLRVCHGVVACVLCVVCLFFIQTISRGVSPMLQLYGVFCLFYS